MNMHRWPDLKLENIPLNGIGWLLYTFYLIYLSLFPYQAWENRVTTQWFDEFWQQNNQLYLYDLLQNLVLYWPFGFLLMKTLQYQWPTWLNFFVCLLSSLCLSFLLEYLQGFNPERVSSALDVVYNVTSAGLGALSVITLNCWYRKQGIPPPLIITLDISQLLALGFLIIWVYYQWFPLVPLLYPSALCQGFAALWLTILELNRFDFPQYFYYVLQGSLIYLLIQCLCHQFALRIGSLLMLGILLIKATMIGRSLSLEALLGGLSGLISMGLLFYLGQAARAQCFTSR